MVLAAATLLGGATRLPAAVQRPGLSGHWTYNPAQSDNPRSMMQRRDSVDGDRRKLKQSVEGGGDVEIKAHWQGNDFVVERKVSGGGKVTEDYLRSQDGKQLYVIVKFEGGRGRSIEFRRVYDGAAAK